MADMKQLETALINADKAGDTQAAKVLAAEITKLRTQEAAPKEAPSGFIQGVMDPIHGGAQLLTKALPDSVVETGNKANNWLADKGLPLARIPEGGVDQMVREREQNYQTARNNAGETGFDWARLGGNVASPAAWVPAIKAGQAVTMGGKVAQGSALGGLFGGMQPVTNGDFASEKAQQVGLGVGAGAALPVVAGGVARMIQPKTDQAVKQLMAEGVTPTPGQIMGGVVKRAEEAARSVPFLGDAISAAHNRGIAEFNRSAINRALAPIGQKMEKGAEVGYKAVEKAYTAISKAYDDLLPNLKVNADRAFVNELNKVRAMAGSMHPARAKQFENILKNDVLAKFERSGKMAPQTMKEVDSKLGKLASDGMKSMDLDQQQLGAAVRELQSSLRSMVERGNPQYAGKLKQINSAYANLLRVENAAARQGAKDGVFTPNQLEAATRALDPTLRKRASAHGKALMQDLATAGDRAITNKLPNSGTIDRALWNVGGLASGVMNPVIPVGLGAASGLYLPASHRLLAKLLTARPQAAQPMAEAVRKSVPYLTPGAVSAGNGLLAPVN